MVIKKIELKQNIISQEQNKNLFVTSKNVRD